MHSDAPLESSKHSASDHSCNALSFALPCYRMRKTFSRSTDEAIALL